MDDRHGTAMTALSARVYRALARVVVVREDEVRALLWSFLYFFFLLAGYYVLRPLRDEMGIAGGVKNLQWLFTATFAAMLVAVPLFGALVARFPKRRIVPAVYRFFIVNILIFFALFQVEGWKVHVARAFFVWVSVYNLFVVSVFWSFMADLFRNEQARRLFGFIAAGGTAGALAGPALTATLAVPFGPVNLLLISALGLEIAVQCVHQLLRAVGSADAGKTEQARTEADATNAPIGGSVWAGATEVFRSPYLLAIGVYVVLYTVTSTFLYFQQAHIVADTFRDPAERTRLFAQMDFLVSTLTITVQAFVTGRFMRRFGVGAALAFVPLVTAIGFLALAANPVLVVLVAFGVLRRAGEFAISKPGREVLYTVVSPERKYKAKNFIDTVVYRGGDATSGWLYTGIAALGLTLPAIALATALAAGGWLVLAVMLGRRQDRLARIQSADDTGGAILAPIHKSREAP